MMDCEYCSGVEPCEYCLGRTAIDNLHIKVERLEGYLITETMEREALRDELTRIQDYFGDVAIVSKERDALRARLAIAEAVVKAARTVTDHFVSVMDGPMIAGKGIVFVGGAEGIPTIATVRAALLAYDAATKEGG